MKNIVKTIFAVTVSCVVFAGCNEEKFLSISSPSEVSTNDFPTTLDHATSLVTAAYAQLNQQQVYGSEIGGYIYLPLEYDIDFEYRDATDWIYTTAGKNVGPTGRITPAWQHLNKGVHVSNIAIEGVREYKEKHSQPNEAKVLDNLVGEALYLRAFYWSRLLEIYGEAKLDGAGIPILDHSSASYTDAQISRSTTRKSYEAIVSTLLEAIPLLEGQNDKYRVNKWAAMGLLAKTYFFLGDNANAKTYLEKIINESGKSLVPYKSLKQMFNGDASFEHSSESLWEIEHVHGVKAYRHSYDYKPGTEFSRWITHCSITPDGARKSMDYANLYAHDKNIARFGYTWLAPGNYIHEAAQKPANGFIPFNCSYEGAYLEGAYYEGVMGQKLRALAGNAVYNPGATKPATSANAGAGYSDPDPRFFVGLLHPYIDTCKLSGQDAPVSQNMGTADNLHKWYNKEAATGMDRMKDYNFSLRKYQFLGGELAAEGNNCTGENVYVMRLAEVYLIYAEILKEEGNTADALKYVNMVHRRAYGQTPSNASKYDYKSLTDRTMTVDANDHLANDPIKYELWAELFGEMQWWGYIRHFAIGPKEAQYYDYVHGPGSAGITKCEFPDRHYAQPIPVSELEYNPNMTQTPGYEQ